MVIGTPSSGLKNSRSMLPTFCRLTDLPNVSVGVDEPGDCNSARAAHTSRSQSRRAFRFRGSADRRNDRRRRWAATREPACGSPSCPGSACRRFRLSPRRPAGVLPRAAYRRWPTMQGCPVAHASIPIRHGGNALKKRATSSRRSFRGTTTAPTAFTPCT